MTEQSVVHRTEALLAGLLHRTVERVAHGDTPLRDLGLGSLKMIQLIGDLESAFGIQIRDGDVTGENFGTLNGLVTFLEERA